MSGLREDQREAEVLVTLIVASLPPEPRWCHRWRPAPTGSVLKQISLSHPDPTGSVPYRISLPYLYPTGSVMKQISLSHPNPLWELACQR